MPDAQLASRLATVIGFPVTPFDDRSGLDLEALSRVVDRMLEGGITTIACAAGTGELYAMSPDECAAVYRGAATTARGRAFVIAGVGFGTTVGIALAQEAKAAGCDALLLMPPYLSSLDEAGLIAYYRLVASASDLPCLIYTRDHARLSPRGLAELCQSLPNLIGLKDGTGNIRAFRELRAALGNRLVWLCGIGDDWAPSYFAAGAQGFTSSIANFDPAVAVRLLEICRSGRIQEASDFVDAYVRPFFSLRSQGYDVALAKAASGLAGIPVGEARPPAPQLSDSDRQDFFTSLLRTAEAK